jgi:hypothetical protein
MTTTQTEPVAEPWLDVVRRKVRATRFGSVQIVIHEGCVTQVENTEKTRLSEPESVNGSGASKRRSS